MIEHWNTGVSPPGNWVCLARSTSVGDPACRKLGSFRTIGLLDSGSAFPRFPGLPKFGFVSPPPFACRIHHNSLPIKKLPFTSRRGQLGLFLQEVLSVTRRWVASSRPLAHSLRSGRALGDGLPCPRSRLALFRTIGSSHTPFPKCPNSPKFGFVCPFRLRRPRPTGGIGFVPHNCPADTTRAAPDWVCLYRQAFPPIGFVLQIINHKSEVSLYLGAVLHES
jgi:hypothetical protein